MNELSGYQLSQKRKKKPKRPTMRPQLVIFRFCIKGPRVELGEGPMAITELRINDTPAKGGLKAVPLYE